jgi:hypothetical protein
MRRHGIGRIGFVFPAAILFLAIAYPANAILINGGFDTGNFSGWTHAGFLRGSGGPNSGGPNYANFLAAQVGAAATPDSNAVVASQTSTFDGFGIAGPAVLPTSDGFLAFISNQTSIGNNTLTGSSISQTFTLPIGATSLAFDARLLNDDSPTSFVAFDDFGGLALTQGATVLAQFNIDLNPASAANAHVTAGANVGGFRNSTNWLSSAFNVAGLGAQSVTLTAYSVNFGGDNSFETRLLLDNVRLNAVATTPEPSGFFLLMLGTLVVLCNGVRSRNINEQGH